MPLSERERAYLRARWRLLCQAAGTGDVAALRDFKDVTEWRSPLDRPAGARSLFALAQMAKGYVAGSGVEQAQLFEPLRTLARLAGDLLDAADPGAHQLPFRRDVDG